ncbi:hypothetical protein EIN_064420 [Entamoeba invadens IP1]|uniref:Nucleotidyltransferase n=1 Tax=Entamoeba invadens IP1 TaxID=370355 RepID=A0A0A1TV67_ENTIV|nr:hypothetical protein EIN_064420 [Entamoeba invadens IP1]ELP84217.1 hypothetical protein EIN_064420 [Entamoeba invadens IP1]|eukprot:XP_004183563.1 hypothetical protein EIN_064420 [Entamoeba invadens IP1]
MAKTEKRSTFMSADRLVYVREMLQMRLIITPQNLINDDGTFKIVTTPYTLLNTLYTTLEKNGISVERVELIGSSVRSLMYDDPESIDIFDIDVAFQVKNAQFDNVLQAEEDTLLLISKKNKKALSPNDIPSFFVNKALVTEPVPWALVSVGSLGCMVDIKVSTHLPISDFSVNSINLDLTEIIQKGVNYETIIPITSHEWDIQQVFNDVEKKVLRWKDSTMRRMGLRYVLMKVKGYTDLSPTGKKEFGNNIVNEFVDKPDGYFSWEIGKFVHRHFCKNGYDFEQIFRFLDVLNDTLETNQQYGLFDKKIDENYIFYKQIKNTLAVQSRIRGGGYHSFDAKRSHKK